MEKGDHLFKASFEAPISNIKHIDELGDSSMMISRASVDEFDDYFPSHVGIDKNFDLLGIYFDAANVNKFNKKGQGISSDLAVEILSLFNHKPTNIEHNQSKVVGHIVNAIFTEHGDSNKIISKSDAKKMTDVFDISLASVVYSLADKDFSDLVEMAADKENAMHGTISASWELGFSDYDLAVGSDLISECEIISDPAEVKALSSHLRIYEGTGFLPDGRMVSQLIRKAIPIGIGFTSTPAGFVSGVATETSEKKEEILSQNKDVTVKLAKATKITKMDDITKAASEAALTQKLEKILLKHEISETSMASITESFSQKLEEANTKFVEERAELTSAANAAETKVSELETSVANQAKELKELKEKADTYEVEKAQALAIATRDARLEEIEDEFVVGKDARVAILNQIDGMNEEAYASYRSQLDVLLSSSKKSVIEQARIDAEEIEQAKASVISETSDEDIKKTIDTAKASSKDVIPNGSEVPTTEDKSFSAKFASAFEDEDSVQVKV